MSLKPNRFIEKSILGTIEFLKDAVFAEEYASKNGLLQSLDPRTKLVSFALFILTVLFMKGILPIVTLYCFTLLLALASKIDLGYFLKRTWIFIPIFSLFIAIPALFSFFSPGTVVFTFRFYGASLSVTQQGLYAAGLFVSRVITSVSMAILLSLTTGHSQILQVLRLFRVPAIFVMTIGMCYRYIYLFVKIIEETYLALKSRAATAISAKRGQRIASWHISNLWLRSFYLHKEVYKAMVSRGYTGEIVIADHFKSRAKDWVWLAASAAVCAGLLYYGNAL